MTPSKMPDINGSDKKKNQKMAIPKVTIIERNLQGSKLDANESLN